MDPLPEVMSYEDWMKQTSKALLKRSKELKSVDLALQKYQRTPSQPALIDLKKAFEAWKKAHGNGTEWQDSKRNTNNYATLLDNQLAGKGDTDAALGAQSFMEPALINSRLGVIYLYSNLECNDMFKVILEGAIDFASAGLDFAGADDDKTLGNIKSGLEKAQSPGGSAARFVETKIRDSINKEEGKTKAVSSTRMLESATPGVPARLMELWGKIRDKLAEWAQKILAAAKAKWEDVKEKWRWAKADPGGTALEISQAVLGKLVNFIATVVLAKAVPFLGAAIDVGKGILTTIDAAFTKIQAWRAGKDVELVVGHPATIADAIHRAMWVNIGKGVYETCKSGLDLGMQFASSGASAIVSLVVAGVEALTKTIWKLLEIVKMRAVFSQARELWKTRTNPDALHLRPIAFNAWFKGHAMIVPALPVLVLNTGICGDKMHFVKMFKDDNSVITQDQFDAGCAYVDRLKAWGSDYLNDSGFGFSTKDPMVKGLVKLAGQHELDAGVHESRFKTVMGFVNG